MRTLKTLLLVCLLSIGFAGANAQQFNWGIKAGLNMAELDADDCDFRPAFHAGFAAQYMFRGANGFGVEADLLYSMRGGKFDNGFSSDNLFTASYVELPIQFLYKFNIGERLVLYPSAGGYVAYGFDGSDDYFDTAEEFDAGWMAGLNLQIAEKFVIGAAYQGGLLEVFKDSDVKNRNITLSLSYFF